MLILIAPPETEHDLTETWTGNTDTALSEAGRGAAENLRYFDSIDVDRAFVAPQAHHVEFAKIVLTRREYEAMPEMSDRSMGTLTGRTHRETMGEFPRRNWLAWHRSYWTAPPAGESFFDISERIRTALQTKIMPIGQNDRVAIIAAPDVLRLIVAYINKTDEIDVPKIRIEPCVAHVLNGDLA